MKGERVVRWPEKFDLKRRAKDCAKDCITYGRIRQNTNDDDDRNNITMLL